MSSPESAGIPAIHPPHTTELLERFARMAAIILGGAYVAGFVIVNLHHAELGIPDLSLLRPRVVSAGVFFLVMTAVPVIGTARIYGLLGLEAAGGVVFRTQPGDERIGRVIYMLLDYQLCFVLAFFTRVFFDDTERTDWTHWAFVVLAALVFTVGSQISYRHPRKCAVLVAVAMVGLAWSARVGWGKVFFDRSIWFYLCSLGTVWCSDYLSRPEQLKKMRLEMYVGIPVVLLLFFSTRIYGNARSQFGGGAPISVLIHFNPELSKLLGSDTSAVWLVEQTDDAIYILRGREDQRAIQVPRNQVRAVEFKYTPPQSLPKHDGKETK